MEGYAYYNGKIGRCDDISIPLTDRLIYFGDGVYDVITGHSGRLFLADDHLDRLFYGMKFLGIIHNFTKDHLLSLIYKLIHISKYKNYLIYISCSRSANERHHSYIDFTSTNLLITIKEFYPPKDAPLRLITTKDERYNYCNIKTVNLLPAVLASTLAETHGCDEAVFVTDEIVTECAHSNIFIIQNGKLVTHPESNRILPGIIRKYLIKTAAEFNIPIIERGFTISEMLSADEIIVTSSTRLAECVGFINGKAVGGKNPVLLSMIKRKLKNSYQNI